MAATILVVDDEVQLAALMACLLERHGYRTLVAHSAPEALRKFSEQPASVDLVLSDVLMPGGSGPDMVARMLEIRSGLKALFVTAYPGHSTALLPGFRILNKPFRPGDLLEAVRAALENAAGRRKQRSETLRTRSRAS